MNDDQIEDLLRRVRPAGPGHGLRGRILGAAPAASGRAWPWAVAAAALLALVIGLRASTDRVYRSIEAVTHVEVAAPADPAAGEDPWR